MSDIDTYACVRDAVGEQLFSRAQKSRVLVVGAGGIGCELLKNLVLHGFENIDVVDVDTIDLTNLNRQFLFRHQHIGHSKAETAAAAARAFNSRAKMTAHHGNIKASQFGTSFVQQFDLVMNALDNLDARRHVNRVCLATDRPLVESGTAGFLGQVTVIRKGRTECYECSPKPTQKTYAVCTIRSTPSKPVHCIVWAKEMLAEQFAPADAGGGGGADDEFMGDESVIDDAQIREADAQLAATLREKGAARHSFQRLFHYDVFRRRRVAELADKNPWKELPAKPEPLSFDEAVASGNGSSSGDDDHRVLSVSECCTRYIEAYERLQARVKAGGAVAFDKDDDDAMLFVAAAANLRSHIFRIPCISYFECKSIAGNIVPAIATTNAVIAGLVVLEALKVLDDRLDDCRSSYLNLHPSGGRKITYVQLDKPNPNCYVCSSAFRRLVIDTQTETLGVLVDDVLRGVLGYNEPAVMAGAAELYECGDDVDSEDAARNERQKSKRLCDLRVTHNSVLTVIDKSQGGMVLELSVEHRARADILAAAAAAGSERDEAALRPFELDIGSKVERKQPRGGEKRKREEVVVD